MSKKKLVLASVALTACLCWAFRASQAEPGASSPANIEGPSVQPSTGGYAGPVLTSIARNVEASDPSQAFHIARPLDSRHSMPVPPNFVPLPELEAQRSRAVLACTTVAFHNGTGGSAPFFSAFGGTPAQGDNEFDDCILPPDSTTRFICAAQVRTFGSTQLNGPATYDLRVQAWSDCPENLGSVLLAQGDFMGLPNDAVERVSTITIEPAFFNPQGTAVWVGVQSANVDAGWLITRDANDIASTADDINDIGSTANYVAILNGQGDCSDNLFFGNITNLTYAGRPITLFGSVGLPGSCCHTDSVGGCNNGGNPLCCDNVLQSACITPVNDFRTRSWSPLTCSQRTDCVACNVAACPNSNPLNLEQEADCFTNYVDTSNRGCQNLTVRALANTWTPLSCGQNGCGRTGTYTFLNSFSTLGQAQTVSELRRDDDAYLLNLTQDKRVTWTVTGKFPSEALISFTVRQTNGGKDSAGNPTPNAGVMNCPTFVLNQAPIGLPADSAPVTDPRNNPDVLVSSTCSPAVATALLPGRNSVTEGPFRYLLRARPSITSLSANALCGIEYSFNVQCENVSITTGACCVDSSTSPGNVSCEQISRTACLILTGSDSLFYRGDGIACGSANPPCSPVPVNDTCLGALGGGASYNLTCESCVIPIDNTFAHSTDPLAGVGSGGAVAKDMYFHYTVPQPQLGGCTSGRIMVSTIGACFNSKLQLFRLPSCSASNTTKCSALTSANLTSGGTFNLIQWITGPPIVNVGPFIFGKGNALSTIGDNATGCWVIRVGGNTEDDFGAALLNIDFKCENPSSSSWDLSSGRCCFWDGVNHVGSCKMAGFSDLSGTAPPSCCNRLGGYLRNTSDFFEGGTDQNHTEALGAGCASLPCPQEGEACFNAWDLNSLLTETLQGGGFGTITRLTRKKQFFRYRVPATTPVGSAITIDSCGTLMDTGMEVWRGFNLQNGECDANGGATGYGNGNTTACGNVGFPVGYGTGDHNTTGPAGTSGTEIVRSDDCGGSDPFNGHSGAGDGANPAALTAGCFSNFEVTSCVCLPVVASLVSETQKAVHPGGDIWIGIGRKITPLTASTRAFRTPQRWGPNDPNSLLSGGNCGPDIFVQLKVSNSPACFTCSLGTFPTGCPGGSLQQAEATCAQDYLDTTNRGCKGQTSPEVKFTTLTLSSCPGSVTVCGNGGTYRVNKACNTTSDCDLGDNCTTGTCQGPTDNEQDYDYYEVVVTSPRRITWSVTSTFPAELQILSSPTDGNVVHNCDKAKILNTQTTLAQCLTTTISTDVCGSVSTPQYVYLVVVPANTSGVPCGSLYYATVSCDTPSIPAGACCKGDMNNDGSVTVADIPLFVSQLIGIQPPQLDPAGGCFNVVTCLADFNNDYKVDGLDIRGFVQALLAATSCGATACGDSAACHNTSGDDLGVVSDLGNPNANLLTRGGGTRCADDFKPSGTSGTQTISSLCWFGFYFDYSALDVCNPTNGDTPDNFKVSIYQDSTGPPNGAGVPGTRIYGPAAVTPAKVASGNLIYLGKQVTRYKYTVASLPATQAVVNNGQCYWVEVVNQTTGACLWHWETSAHGGNGVAVVKASGTSAARIAGNEDWYPFDVVADDFAWCMPGARIEPSDCAVPSGQCCVYDNIAVSGHGGSNALSCNIVSRPFCENVLNGRFKGKDASGIVPTPDCSSGVASCPVIPGNDFCENAILITSSQRVAGGGFAVDGSTPCTASPCSSGIIIGDTRLAARDGPFMSCEQSCGGACNTAFDVWYKWIAPATGSATIHMCEWDGAHDPVNYPASVYRFDAMMVVYDGCPNSGGTQVGLPGHQGPTDPDNIGGPGCNDDGCQAGGTFGTTSKVQYVAGGSATGVTAGKTYWIRVSGWGGVRSAGKFTLHAQMP